MSHEQEIYPMAGSFPMGFSWSLFVAQRINELRMDGIDILRKSDIVTDRGKPVVFTHPGKKDHPQVRHYVYVDNLGIISPHRGLVQSALSQLPEAFDAEGLILHPGELQHERVKALGCELRGDILATRLTPERFHKVRLSIEGVLRRRKVTGQVLEIVLGHATFCALTCRSLMSIFNTIYRFIQSNYYCPAVLWRTVREELVCFKGLMIYLHSDWWRGWNGMVSCSDSSTTGYGVSTSFWDPAVVARCGRTLERSRFRKLGAHSARDSALTSAGFIRDEITGKWRSHCMEDQEYLEASGWSINHNFEEVPASMLHKELWQPKLWGKWEYPDNIVVLEGRALVKSLKRIALTTFGHSIRQLLLVDNLSVALAFDRCRSRDYKLLKQIRRFCGYLLSRNISASIRWVPSELNNSDEPSRYFSDEPSKLLTDSIPHGSHVGLKERKELEAPVGEAGQEIGSTPTSFGSSRNSGYPKEKGHSGVGAAEFEGGPQKHQGSQRHFQPGRCLLEAHSHREAAASSSEFIGFKHELNSESGREEIQEDVKDLGAQDQEKSQEDSGCWHGNARRSKQHHLLRAQGRQGRVVSSVPPGTGTVHGLLTSSRPGDRQCREGGSLAGRLPQQAIPRRASSIQRRQSGSSFHARESPIREEWRQEDPSDMEGHQRISQDVPWKVQEGLSFGSVGSNGNSDERDEAVKNGYLSSDGRLFLFKALGIAPCSGFQSCEASSWSDFIMEPAFVTGGESSQFEDGRVRYFHSARLPMVDQLGTQDLRGSQEWTSGRGSVGLQLHRVLKGVQEGGRQLRPGHHSIPDKTQWPIHRPISRISKPSRSAKARTVEITEECDPLREECPSCINLGENSTNPPFPLPGVRRRPWGVPARKAGISRVPAKRRGQYVMDLFSGEGGVSKACIKLGFNAKQWDIKYGACHDLTDPKVVRRIITEIRRGKVLSVMMAPVCTSFSVARDRTKVIRNRRYPWGIPKQYLTEAEKEKVVLGNKVFKTCAKIIEELLIHGIPFILENPRSSKAWFLPVMQSLLTHPSIHYVVTDFCQWGTPWKKPTAFMVGNLDSLDSRRLEVRCSGPRGLCSRTGQRHFLLTGSNGKGVPYTRVAQPYPKKLCSSLAFVLTCKFATTQNFG